MYKQLVIGCFHCQLQHSQHKFEKVLLSIHSSLHKNIAACFATSLFMLQCQMLNTQTQTAGGDILRGKQFMLSW